MRVLQVLPSLSAGGAESFIAHLGISLVREGTDVQVFLLGGVRGERGRFLYEELRRAGVVVWGKRERYPGSIGNMVSLVRILRNWGPDVVHANLYPAEVACAIAKSMTPGVNAALVRRIANTEVVGPRPARIVRFMDRIFHVTIACSDVAANAYRRLMGNNQRSVLATIPNGGFLMDTPPTVVERYYAKRSFGIDPDEFVVTHIGRMATGRKQDGQGLASAQKGHDVLVQAYAEAFGSDSTTWLVLVGDGELECDVRALAESHRIRDRTRFLGQVSQPWEVLTATDVFIFPSRYEGMPNALLEAGSAGVPVVASQIPEIEALSPGKAWQMCPVDDVNSFATSLRRVKRNRRNYLRLANEVATEFVQRHSMRTCARSYLRVYKDAVSSTGLSSRN